MRVLIIGRFQPFHLGHLELLRQARKHGDIIIAIGSSNESMTWDNPMTFEERKECIEKVLRKEKVKADIVPIPDFHDNDRWVDYLVGHVPEFGLALTGNELVTRLLRERGYDVEEQKYLEDRWKYKGANVRETIKAGRRFDDMVPGEVASFLKGRKIVERIRAMGECCEDDRRRERKN